MFPMSILGVITLVAVAGNPSVTIPADKHSDRNASAVAISADGSLVAAGFGGGFIPGPSPMIPSGRVVVWDRKTGKQLHAFKQVGDILRVGFSSDGRYLAYNWIYTPGDSIHARQVVLVDLKKGEAIHRWESVSFAFSPTKNHLLVGHRSEIEMVEVPSLKQVRTISVPMPRTIAVSADGKSAAALGSFWQANRRSGDGLYYFGLDNDASRIRNGENLDKAQSLILAPDGKQIVTGHDGGEARIWSTADLDARPRLLSHDTPLAVFPLYLDKGATLGVFTQPANGVNWRYGKTDPQGLKVEKGRTPPWADLFRYDLSADPPKAIHWRAEDASYRTVYARFRSTRGHPEVNSRRYILSTDGKTLVIGCNGCTLVDASTGKIERSFSCHE